MKKSFYLKKPVHILIAKIVNYESLLTILGNDACNGMMKHVSDQMKDALIRKNNTAELYYLENGMFAAVSESEDMQYYRDASNTFAKAIYGSFQYGKLELEMDSCLSVFRCPQDFDN